MYEKASELVSFMQKSLSATLREFQIPIQIKTCDNIKLSNGDEDAETCSKTLKELKLYPAVTVTLCFDEDIRDQLGDQPLLAEIENPLL